MSPGIISVPSKSSNLVNKDDYKLGHYIYIQNDPVKKILLRLYELKVISRTSKVVLTRP